MTAAEITTVSNARRGVGSATVPLFVAASFLSAVLLFSLEPLFSKMVLPILGGAAAVWSVAMVVFQALLLAGYLYAHLLVRFLPLRRQVLVHAAVMVVCAIVLPVALARNFGAPPEHNVALWTMALFLVSIGPPYFAVAANAPLLQAWLSRTSHPDADQPYFLYRASNAGSFMVLLAYPFLIEPQLGLHQQSLVWSTGYGVLIAGLLSCGVIARRGRALASKAVAMYRPSWNGRFWWAALGFIPSGLLIAVTAHIATDVASAPFLWIIPLSLYLLTFVLAFSDRPLIPMRALTALLPVAAALLVILFLWGNRIGWIITLPGHLFAFFVASMLCQASLYARRPPAAALTSFYLWVSLGGVLGGIFAALLAPALFNVILEYPLLAIAAVAAHPDVGRAAWKEWRSEIVFVAVTALALAAPFILLHAQGHGKDIVYYIVAVTALAGVIAFQQKNPVRLLLFGAVALLTTSLYDPSHAVLFRARSFYGAYRVLDVSNGRFHVLYDGVISHGAEQMRDAGGHVLTGEPQPLTYYYFGGPLSDAIDAVRRTHGGRLTQVASIGLGIGALACHAEQGEDWTYYELDPLVVAIAENRALFRTMVICGRNTRVVDGDARLTLARAKDKFDLIILDAFSSDAVPVHLLTKEAMALYRAKLAPHGVLVLNISNRNLELASVVDRSARANGMVSVVKRDPADPDSQKTMKDRAEIAVVAQSKDDLDALKLDRLWKSPDSAGVRTWTDDYSDIPDAILRKLRRG